jgi:hypothetical protein
MQEIPIQSIPSQVVRTVLAGQNVQIKIYQKDQGVFVDVNSDSVDVGIGTIARNAVPLVCRDYARFLGNLLFLDTQGNLDPDYTGFNNRYRLVYLTAEEYALI